MKLHWGNAIFIFFVIFLSLAIFFIFFSLRQSRDLITENYYEKGAEYTKQININERSFIFNDSITISINDNTVTFGFCDSITNNSDFMLIDFYRPSDKNLDYKIKFDAKTKIFAVNKSNLAKGRYIVRVLWKMNTLNYEVKKDLFID